MTERRATGFWTSSRVLALSSVLLSAAVMRPAIVAFGPVAGRIGEDLGLNSSALGVLAAVPVFVFGLVSAFISAPARRFGFDRILFAALVTLAVGMAVRLLPGAASIWIGTAIVGAGIAALNVLLPAIVKRDFPTRAPVLTGVYSSVLVTAAAIGVFIAAPITAATGGNWRVALAASLPLTIIALGVAAVRIVRDRRAEEPAAGAASLRGPSASDNAVRDAARSTSDAVVPTVAPDAADRTMASVAPTAVEPAASSAVEPAASSAVEPGASNTAADPGRRPTVWRSPLAWAVTAFMGLQSTLFYTFVNWMPSIEHAAGIPEGSAGLHLSLAQLAGVPFGLLAGALMNRHRDHRVFATAVLPFAILALLGMVFLPGAMGWWVLMFGGLTGALLPVALALIAERTSSAAEAAALSGMSQSVGYAIAGLGPFVGGALYDLTGEWNSVLWMLIGVSLLLFVAGLIAGRDAKVSDAKRAEIGVSRG